MLGDVATCCHGAAHVLGPGSMDGCNPEEDEHTLAVTCAIVCAIRDGAMTMVLEAT